MQLHTPITTLKSVGPTTAKRLGYLGVTTVGDLLAHYPFRYDDFSSSKPIRDLVDREEVTIAATVSLVHSKRSPRKRMIITEAVVMDETGQMKIVWFGQPYIAKQLMVGETYHFSGKVNDTMFGMQLKNPSFERIGKDTKHTGRIVPIYPTTAGLTQRQIRLFVSQALEAADELEEWIPDVFLDKADTIALSEAVRGVHYPDNADHLQAAIRRMKFDELFLHQLHAERIRQTVLGGEATPILFVEDVTKAFVAELPFELTQDQKVAAWQILQDLARDTPMNRLLEGDVGSGKTVVAGLVANTVVDQGKQVALMAPTAILAEQHFHSFCQIFPTHTVVALKTGDSVKLHNASFGETSKAGQKREFLRMLASGEIDIAVGTHALISNDVYFHHLSLAIVDEQHRFGVEQRRLLKDRSGKTDLVPHFLSMTATPIPRSYALALYGDLDISIIKTMPKGRKPVNTQRISESQRQAAYDMIREEITSGRQAFVICPMIDASGEETSEKKTVLAEYEKLSKNIFPDLRVEYIHGALKSAEKDAIMERFATGQFDILVSTSVIEVGVHIPNASVMIIEGADRFGLAQLHQFRGRVGRSIYQSYCFLFTDSLSKRVEDRLDFFCATVDGFRVAEYDLELRGPGEVYGKAQSGAMQFQFASLTDTDLIAVAQQCVRGIKIAEYPTIQKRLHSWESSIHLE